MSQTTMPEPRLRTDDATAARGRERGRGRIGPNVAFWMIQVVVWVAMAALVLALVA